MDWVHLRSGLLVSIGASKAFGASVAIQVYGLFLTPDSAFKSDLPAGAATSVLISGNVTGGVGPFTYAWTNVFGGVFTINSPTNSSTTFTTSGIAGQLKSGGYRLTVTDTGNSNAQETADIVITFEFAGTPL